MCTGSWFVNVGKPSRSRVFDLYCLPHAGGSASAYSLWPGFAPRWLRVRPIELPGHGSRLSEQPYRDLATLAEHLAREIIRVATSPFALFGHSMGGLIAYETTRALRRLAGPVPVRLFLSSMAVPSLLIANPRLHQAADDDFVEKLRFFDGTPPEVLQSDELLEAMLPVMRADFEILGTYQYHMESRLETPITVFGGLDDRIVHSDELPEWQDLTSSARIKLFPGGHFYIKDEAAGVMEEITKDLRGLLMDFY